jgi:hypothetical protein
MIEVGHIRVMHGADCVAVQIDEPVPTVLVLTLAEADWLVDQLREQALYARTWREADA